MPSDKDSCPKCYNCEKGKIWNDNYGYSCKAYHYGKFCIFDEKTQKWNANYDKPGWSYSYGKISDYKNACRNAFDACGACGFGDGNDYYDY